MNESVFAPVRVSSPSLLPERFTATSAGRPEQYEAAVPNDELAFAVVRPFPVVEISGDPDEIVVAPLTYSTLAPGLEPARVA